MGAEDNLHPVWLYPMRPGDPWVSEGYGSADLLREDQDDKSYSPFSPQGQGVEAARGGLQVRG